MFPRMRVRGERERGIDPISNMTCTLHRAQPFSPFSVTNYGPLTPISALCRDIVLTYIHTKVEITRLVESWREKGRV